MSLRIFAVTDACAGCGACIKTCPEKAIQPAPKGYPSPLIVLEDLCSGCAECADFLGPAADISVGSVGSADGYSSVLVRSEEGLAAFELVREKLELRQLDKPEALGKLDALDKRIAFGSLKRAFDPEAPLFIDFEEHLENYSGTDRAPVEHEAVRY